MEITVLSHSNSNGFINSVLRCGEIYMSDVKDMVKKVVAELGGRKIIRLNIVDRSDDNGVFFGKDYVDGKNFDNFLPSLAKLYHLFDKSALVHFRHRKAGNNKDLLRMFALTFGVPVCAEADFGAPKWVRCNPSGMIIISESETL